MRNPHIFALVAGLVVLMAFSCNTNKGKEKTVGADQGLERPVLPAAPKERDFKCHGNEPSWGIEVKVGETITLSRIGEAAEVFPYVEPIGEEGRESWVFNTRNEAGNVLTLAVRNTTCNDGMANTEYPYTASAILNNKTYFKGCGR